MKNVKVLHIITRLDPGGSSTNTIETAARLNKDKYNTYLLSGKTNDPTGEIKQALMKKGISITFCDSLVREINPVKDCAAFFQIFSFVKKGGFDIVHTHSSKAGIIGRLAAKLVGAKIIVHTPHGHVFYGYFNKLISWIFILAERFTACFTDKIITLTKKGKDDHVKYKIASRDKFVPIYSGIETYSVEADEGDYSKIRNELYLAKDTTVFGTLTRLDPVKGNEYLIEAMSEVVQKLPNSKLLIVGDGERRNELETLTQKLQVEKHVQFLGYRDDAKRILNVFDIFVLASLNEGMGRAILEAMASAKPVIATNVGGIPELVIERENGLLVEPANPHKLAEAMVQLADDYKKMCAYGLRGRQMISDTFSIDKMVSDIDHLYDDLINKRK